MKDSNEEFKDEAVEELERQFLDRVREAVGEAVDSVKGDLAEEVRRPVSDLANKLGSLCEDFSEFQVRFRRELQSIKEALPESNFDQLERIGKMVSRLSETIHNPSVLQRLWTAPNQGEPLGSEFGAGVVCFGRKSGLHVVDSMSGRQINVFETASGVAPDIAFSDGLVYFGCYDGTLFAVDPLKCLEKWRRNTMAKAWNSLAAARGMVCFGPGDSCLHAIDASTGQDLWKFTGEGRTFSRPTILDGGNLWVGCSTGRVYALDSRTGERRWTFDSKNFSCASPLVLGFEKNDSGQ